ncbi:MAG TPA: type II toxin-antitoxin system PemK/MazF family toxin [Chloroflexota bacterium]|nr:type II toxin-antitoxin system PemK/MazF family toxin [Chloroflexota bacterium]
MGRGPMAGYGRDVAVRGAVWWADLGPARGSAPAWRRPAVIVSSNSFNRSAIRAVTIVPLTTSGLPGHQATCSFTKELQDWIATLSLTSPKS